MSGVIGDTLPLGLGIALNPIAIVLGILILAKTRARGNGVAFTIGWVLGLTALLLLASLIVEDRARADPESTRAIVQFARIGLGIVLIVAAVRELRQRVRPEEAAPRWLRMVDRVGAGRSLALGLFLSVVSLKNLALAAAAATVIGQAGLGQRGVAIVVALFVAIGTLGILGPLLVHLFGGEKADDTLAAWRNWLEVHIGAITAVVMILLGAHLIGQGLRGLF